ncbi:MAG: tetratricopeptide repeat protein [Bryobacteraceae bacterium]
MLRTFQRGVMWAAVCAVSAGLASAQMGTFMGRVLGEDGKPVQGVIIKIERKDIKGNWQTKTNKRGEWVYSGMPIGGVFTISCEYNGQVMDVLNGVRSQMGDPVELKDFCDLQKIMAKRKAMEKAQQTGQVSQEVLKEMTPEQRAAMEKQLKERAAQMARNKALNDAFNAGYAALQAKDYQTAIENLQKASEIDPKQVAVWAQLAAAYEGMARTKTGAERDEFFQKAADAYVKAIELQPGDAGLHNNYGLVLAQMKKLNEASAELEKAVALDPPGGGKYMYNLGAVYINTNQVEPAIAAFKKAIELDPKYAPAWYQYCTAMSGKMQLKPDGTPIPPEGMKEACEKYLELDANGPNAEAVRGLLQLISGKIETTYENPDAKKATRKKK